MATPPESPVEEHAYELEPSRTPKPIPVALEELCRQTKFSKQEIRVMYRGFKTVSPSSVPLLSTRTAGSRESFLAEKLRTE